MKISEEAVEAAAMAAWERDHPAIQWDVIGQARQYELRLTARVALEAAAPHMLERAWNEGFSAALSQWRKRSDLENPYRSAS